MKKYKEQSRRKVIRRKLHDKKVLFIKNWQLLVLCIPTIVALLLFSYVPMFGTIMVFKRYRIADDIFGSVWNGFANLEFLFGSSELWRISRNKVGYNLTFMLIGTVVNVGVALLAFEIDSKKCLTLRNEAEDSIFW